MYFFSSFWISFKKFSRNFNEDILRLVLAFIAFVGSVATSGVGSSVRVISKIFIGNNLLFKVVRNFSLALK